MRLESSVVGCRANFHVYKWEQGPVGLNCVCEFSCHTVYAFIICLRNTPDLSIWFWSIRYPKIKNKKPFIHLVVFALCFIHQNNVQFFLQIILHLFFHYADEVLHSLYCSLSTVDREVCVALADDGLWVFLMLKIGLTAVLILMKLFL